MQLIEVHISPDPNDGARSEATFRIKGSMAQLIALINHLTGPLPVTVAGSVSLPSGPALAPSYPVGPAFKEQVPSVPQYDGEQPEQAAERVIVEQKANGSAARVSAAEAQFESAAEAVAFGSPALPTKEPGRKPRAPKIKPVEEPVTADKQPNLPHTDAAPPSDASTSSPIKIEKIHNGEFSILYWQEQPGKYLAQIEVGQDPAISGLMFEAVTDLQALAGVSDLARAALAKKNQAAQPVPVPSPDDPVDVPPALTRVTSFGKVIDWFVSPEGGGFEPVEENVQAVGDKCLALKAHVPVIGRVGGDIYDRVRRRFAVIMMEREQAAGA